MYFFLQYLQRNGKINVEETERGFIIEYIDKEKIRREQEADAKRKVELTAEQRREKQLKSQVEAAWEEKRKDGGDSPNEVRKRIANLISYRWHFMMRLYDGVL